MYDVIVIGLGSMGSSTLYQLAKAGVHVLGLERYGIVHDFGSHSGQTRIVRKAYFEHPNYVPLLQEAYKGWETLEVESGEQLFIKTGLAYYGSPGQPIMEGIKESARLYDVELNEMAKVQSQIFDIPDDYQGLFEPDAGYVLTSNTIKAYIHLAERFGAVVKTNEKVFGFDQSDDLIIVKTNNSEFRCKKLVITAGPMISDLVKIPDLNQMISLQYLFWVKAENPKLFQKEHFPCWMIADDNSEGVFYGFPIENKLAPEFHGLYKVAHHVIGEEINDDPDQVFNSGDEHGKIRDFLDYYLPNTTDQIASMSLCKYTNSEDGHFIIDVIPGTNDRVIIATGFSGHGFKFVPVVGEILKDLATKGSTRQPIDFLSLDRFK